MMDEIDEMDEMDKMDKMDEMDEKSHTNKRISSLLKVTVGKRDEMEFRNFVFRIVSLKSLSKSQSERIKSHDVEGSVKEQGAKLFLK
jgi:hypothetical protein